jgi:hypothetical protein
VIRGQMASVMVGWSQLSVNLVQFARDGSETLF